MAVAGLVTQLVLNGVLSHSKSKAETRKKEWGYIALAVISGVMALAFLTAAMYMALGALYTAPIAALLTGLAMCLASLACVFGASRAGSKADLESWARKELANEQLAQKVDELFGDIERPVKENPGTAVLLASLAGFLAADKLH